MKTLIYRLGNFYSCRPDWTWKVSSMKDFDIWIVNAGKGELECDGVKYEISCGDGFIFKPGASICASHFPDSPLKVVACHFDMPGRVFPQLYSRERRHVHRKLAKPEITAGLLSLAVGSALEKRNKDADFWITAAVKAYFNDRSMTGSYPGHSMQSLESLCAEISENPGRKWTIRGIAARLRYSGDHCRRLFLKHKGMPPMEYVICRRIDRACFLLKYTDMRIGEISSELKYSSVYFFSRQFKRVRGVAPGEYRKR